MANYYRIEDVQILVATMHRNSLDFLIPMFPNQHFSNFNILVVNQTEEDKLVTSTFDSVKVINSFVKGLSKSRNLALQNASKKIVVITDDDVIFKPDFLEKIVLANNQFPNYAFIGFQAENKENKLLKKYANTTKTKLSWLDILNVASIEMTLNRDNFNENFLFDENFGLGATFEMGEEALFLADLKRNQKQLAFVPETIVIHPHEHTNDKKEYKERYFIQGAFFSRLFPVFAPFWILLKIIFDIKQHKLKWRQLSEVIKQVRKGKVAFLAIQNKK